MALQGLNPKEVHHGDSVGADAQFHHIVRELLPNTRIIIHPPNDSEHRAFCVGDETKPDNPYLPRKNAIVESSLMILAAPAAWLEQSHSRTWTTCLAARGKGIQVLMLLPDGSPRLLG